MARQQLLPTSQPSLEKPMSNDPIRDLYQQHTGRKPPKPKSKGPSMNDHLASQRLRVNSAFEWTQPNSTEGGPASR